MAPTVLPLCPGMAQTFLKELPTDLCSLSHSEWLPTCSLSFPQPRLPLRCPRSALQGPFLHLLIYGSVVSAVLPTRRPSPPQAEGPSQAWVFFPSCPGLPYLPSPETYPYSAAQARTLRILLISFTSPISCEHLNLVRPVKLLASSVKNCIMPSCCSKIKFIDN